MKKIAVLAFFLCVLAACSGPVYIAKNEGEGIKSLYQDPKLSELSVRYQPTLQDIYNRYEKAGIDVYPKGIGFTTLSDNEGNRHYYLQVEVRPRDISFGEVQTKPQERFAEVFRNHFQKNLMLMKAADLKDGVDGLAFGVYWPVRDLSQCDSHGGFLEYTIVYFNKHDFDDLAAKNISLMEAVKDAEVVTSLGRQPAKNVAVTEMR